MITFIFSDSRETHTRNSNHNRDSIGLESFISIQRQYEILEDTISKVMLPKDFPLFLYFIFLRKMK